MFVYATLLNEATLTCLTPIVAVDLLSLIRLDPRRWRRAFVVERFRMELGGWLGSRYGCSGRCGKRLHLREL